jgi:hypothetical protein
MKTKTNHLLVKQPLQIEALLAAVRRQTGLDDFGDETFREPLSRLLESCESLSIGCIFSATAKNGRGSQRKRLQRRCL